MSNTIITIYKDKKLNSELKLFEENFDKQNYNYIGGTTIKLKLIPILITTIESEIANE